MNLRSFGARFAPALLVALYLAATYFKAPTLFSAPRFWAEEGIVYFLQARSLPFLDALWATPLGYLSLPANLAGILSASLPLLHAPLGGLIVALAIQLSIPWVILANRYFANSRLRQGMLMLVPLFVIQAFETWLNAINSQFWLMLAAALVLASPRGACNANRHAANAVSVLLAGLASPAAAFLAPLFLLRSFLERQLIWALYGLAVSTGALLVILLIGSGGRTLSFPADLFAVASFFHLLAHNLCTPCSIGLFRQAEALLSLHGLFWAILLIVYAGIWTVVSNTGRWLLAASASLLLFGFMSMLGKELLLTLNPLFASRYFFAPAALLFGALLDTTLPRMQKLLFAIMAMLVVNGLGVSSKFSAVGERDGAAWQQQVRAVHAGTRDVVYFSPPYCAFSALHSPPPPGRLRVSAASAASLRIETAGQPPHPDRGDGIFIYRTTAGTPPHWQHLQENWKPSNLFLYGTERYGHCFGGDAPQHTGHARLSGQHLIIDRAALEPLSGHRFMIGHGEDFGSMLARGDFMELDGTQLALYLPLPRPAGETSTGKRFEPALFDGAPLALCLDTDKAPCGQSTADTFCRLQGLGAAIDFGIRLNSPVTRAAPNGTRCESGNCQRIDWVECQASSQPTPPG